ncbi:NERD domain-containing protein [Labedella phragmitis]|uniref:NERD domain-containing protein n=1 Tax=Labedella phragmitis TaxID=2498849 RepID=A0A3S3ZAN5_9MICO|nr:nuclease-related domain-containing protein [Labedella phragmitis]RWZ52564.1 NERD domain-containing protein [Labedella phragmitis]
MAEMSLARHGVAAPVSLAEPTVSVEPAVSGASSVPAESVPVVASVAGVAPKVAANLALPFRADLESLHRVGRRRAGQMWTERATAMARAAARPTLLRRVFGAVPVKAAEKEAFDAAVGERIVGAELERLPGSWIVLHSLPAPGASGDVDHVVVGPGGLFAITTRYVDGDRVFVADDYLLARGDRIPFARAAMAAARRTAQLAGRTLPPSLTPRPVLVIAGARSVRVGARARAVEVRDHTIVRSWLQTQPMVLDPATVQRVAARVAGAFEESGSSVDEAHHCVESETEGRFQRLERAVTAARRIRSLWRIVAGLAVATGVWIAFAQLPSWLALQLG